MTLESLLLTLSRIKNIVIADKEKLADSWFKPEILGALENVSIDWVEPTSEDDGNGIIEIFISTPNGEIKID